MKKYIVSDPAILNGKPVITGTRIPVSQILFLLGEGYTLQTIHEEYPNVSIKKLQGVLHYLTNRIDSGYHGQALSQI